MEQVKKWIYLPAYLILCQFLSAQPSEQELYYTHTGENIFELYFLSDSIKIGCTPRSIYLLDQGNNMIDTVQTQKIIQNILPISKDLFSASFEKSCHLIQVQDGNNFRTVSTVSYDHNYGVPFFVWVPNGLIGYMPAGGHKGAYKLEYYPIKNGKPDLSGKLLILNTQKKKTDYLPCYRFPTDFYWTKKGLLINCPAYNKLVLFEPYKKTVKHVDYPALAGKNTSYFTFYDHLQDKYYTLFFSKNNPTKVFSFDATQHEFEYLTTVLIQPELIRSVHNGHIHFSSGKAHFLHKIE